MLHYRHTRYKIINIHIMKVDFWGGFKTCPLVNTYRRFERDERSVKLFEYPWLKVRTVDLMWSVKTANIMRHY